MGFVGGMLALIAVIIIIIIAVFLFGLTLLIIGLITRHLAKKKEKRTKAPIILICIGTTVMLLSASAIMYLVLSEDEKRLAYEEYAQICVKAAETDDPQLLYDTFAKDVQSKKLMENCKLFVDSFPEKPYKVEYDEGGSGWSSANEQSIHHGIGLFTVYTDDETYYGELYAYPVNDENPDMLGITRLEFVTENVYCDTDIEFSEKDGIYVEFESENVHDTIIINSLPRPWDESANQPLDYYEVKEYIESDCDDMPLTDFETEFGKANCVYINDERDLNTRTYRLEQKTENGEDLFLYLSCKSDGSIHYVAVVSEKQYESDTFPINYRD